MNSFSRRRALGGGAAFLSLVLSIMLITGLLLANVGISSAQTDGDHDKVSVQKQANAATLNAGDTVTFTITVTTQPFPINGVVLTDTLPTGITGNWTVSGADAVAAGCAGAYAPGATLTCNFGNLGDFGVSVTKTVTVSGQTSAANCPTIRNTAHVDAAASEEETLLANNTSSASVNVLCATSTPTKTPVPPSATPTKTPVPPSATPTRTPVPPSPTPTPPTSQIVPTGTTCQQFLAGTAPNLNGITYNVSGTQIHNVQPGVGFYFVSLPGAGTYTISQSDNGNTPAFSTKSVQVTFTSCDVDHAATVSNTSGGGATITVAGARVVRLVFDPSSVVGTNNASPQPTITYTYVTSSVAGSTDTVGLTRN